MDGQPEKTADEPNSNPLQIAKQETVPQEFNENFGQHNKSP